MFEPRRWPRLPWVGVAAGLIWLSAAARTGGLDWLVIPVGALLLASGIAQILWPGDLRVAQTQAMAAGVGMGLAPILLFALGFGAGSALGAAAVASFALAGAIAVYQEPHTDRVPAPEPSLSLSLQVAVDEAVLGYEQLSVGLPRGAAVARIHAEVHRAREHFAEQGWLTDPRSYHAAPPPLEKPGLRSERSTGMEYEHLRFESLYEPHVDEPGRDRWLGYTASREAHAYVLRHGDGEGPWLVCNNGYRMGWAFADLRIFWRYYRALGLNLLIPVMPLHGPRKAGLRSGDRFFTGDVLDMVHAEAQAMWDIRRLLGWVRAEGATRIGTLGLSLGGYTTALLACLGEGLDCAIAGIPVSDLSRLVWRHGPRLQLDYIAHLGMEQGDAHEVLKVVSPLAMEPRVPEAGRMIFGGIADRLVPPDQVRDLAEHWRTRRLVWYQGGHCTFPMDPRVRQGIDATLRDAGLVA